MQSTAEGTHTRGWPRIAWRTLALAGAMLLAFCALLALVQFGTAGLADNDGFYHMRMGQLIREQGLRPQFPWLPLSILNQDAFYDHHLLYHVYLALFSGDGRAESMILGAKLASILMPALAFSAIWWLLRAQGVRWAWIWALGLCAISEAFLYRMSMPRTQAASLLVLALALHWLLQRRYWTLLPLGFVYVWLYNAFPLLLALCAAVVAGGWLSERRLEWRALLFAGLGIMLGLLINPYFPANLVFIVNHLLPKLGQPETSVGNEWYPYETWTLVENSGLALALWLAGVLGLALHERRADRATLIALLLSIGFGFLLFKSRRFVEYFPAFALIFAALSLGRWNAARLLANWRLPQQLQVALPPALLLLMLLSGLLLNIPRARQSMASARPAQTYAAASAWLQQHTAPGSMIFQTDWDDFPRLFFYNTSNIYLIGLDPTYMQLYDPQLYAEWVDITQGRVENPAQPIRERFQARYVLSDLRHQAFERRARADPTMREVYRDEFAVIYAISNETP